MTQSLPAAGLLLRCLCGLVALTLPAAACSGDARGGSGQTSSAAANARGKFDPKTYALDEAKVRKMGAVMSAWDPKGPKPTSDDPNVMGWMMKGVDFENTVGRELGQNSTATIESVPELKAAIAREGLTPREFAEIYMAYKTAEGHLMVAGLEQLSGAIAGTAAPKTPPPGPQASGVFKDNIDLLIRMDKEGTLPDVW